MCISSRKLRVDEQKRSLHAAILKFSLQFLFFWMHNSSLLPHKPNTTNQIRIRILHAYGRKQIKIREYKYESGL